MHTPRVKNIFRFRFIRLQMMLKHFQGISDFEGNVFAIFMGAFRPSTLGVTLGIY